MSCTGCGGSYGIFKKEVGCEMCGFSFCSKCCNKRKSKKDDTEKSLLVCNKCYNGSEKKPQSYSPPLAHKKRMAAMGSRSQSLAADSTCSHWDNERDKEIAERLQKLKREIKKGSTPSQYELENRLAKLKGMDPSRYTAPPITVYRAHDRRSSTEQTTDLLKQMEEEVQIDMRREKEWTDDITARLSRLKGDPVVVDKEPGAQAAASFHEVPSLEDSMDVEDESKIFEQQSEVLMREAAEDIKRLRNHEAYKKLFQSVKSKDVEQAAGEELDEDEEEANNVLAKLLDVNLEDPDSLNGVHMKSPDSECDKTETFEENEEFPWCVICSEDARIRCFGCDSDLYCLKCFSECHDSLDIKDHKTCPYLKQKA